MGDRLEDKLDELIRTTNQQQINLEKLGFITEKQQEILDHHIKRTDVSEARILQVEKALLKHLSFIKGAIWVFGLAAGTLGVLSKMGII